MTQGINLNDLGLLAKSNPKYAELLGQLAGIDLQIKRFASDAVERFGDASIYYIKTELLNSCYNLYLFNRERNITLGYSWLFDDFLLKCQNKFIETEVEKVVQTMISISGTKKMKESKINWITL